MSVPMEMLLPSRRSISVIIVRRQLSADFVLVRQLRSLWLHGSSATSHLFPEFVVQPAFSLQCSRADLTALLVLLGF